jgi:hypothetical protein
MEKKNFLFIKKEEQQLLLRMNKEHKRGAILVTANE